MNIIPGIAAASCWGVSDWRIAHASRSRGLLPVLLWQEFAGVLIFGTLALALPFNLNAHPTGLLLSGLAGFFHLAGAAAAAVAFRGGPISVAAPLVSSFGIWPLVLSWTFGGTVSAIQALFALLSVAGGVGVAASVRPDGAERKRTTAIGFGIAASATFGIAFWVMGDSQVTDLGPFTPLLVMRSVALVGVLAYVSIVGQPGGFLQWAKPTMDLLSIGLLENLAYLFVTARPAGGLTAAISGSSPIISSGLASRFSREPISGRRWVWIAVSTSGIIGLALTGSR